jgi:hypothetical protein
MARKWIANNSHRIKITGETADALTRVADENGVSVSHVVWQAVARDLWFRGQRREGATLLLKPAEDAAAREVWFSDGE